MSVEDFNNILPPWSKTNLCTRDAFAHVPISSPKSGRTSIKRILEHSTLLNRPVTQDGQASSESAAMIKFAIGKDLTSMVTNSLIILLSEAFLQSHDVRCRHSVCDSVTNLIESLVALGRNVAKTPAVQGQKVDLGGETLRAIVVDDYGRRRRDMLRGVTCRDHGAGRVCGSNGD